MVSNQNNEVKNKPQLPSEDELKNDDKVKQAEQQLKDSEAENVKLKEELENIKNKKVPEEPMPASQKDLPSGMQDRQIVTKVRDASEMIKEKMAQLKDLATLEVLLETSVRMRKRLESIKKVGSAKHIKVRNIWKTTPPEMHISNLQGKKINNDECEITFGVFEMDKKGNKKLYEHFTNVQKDDGTVVKKCTAAEYRIALEVTERIKTGKPITREVLKIDRIQEE